ncbi:MAG: hypothetical protein IT578_06910 [Verrucomicrobiae bacterium]|nr:hypothetical protein [Verrucomicrobiae bacterium]
MNDLSVITAEFGDLSRWMKRPDFWVDRPETGLPFLRSLKTASVRAIGRSAGGREIHAVEMGEKEALDATTDNLTSALASVHVPPDPTAVFPPSFYGKTRRRKPVLALQGGIHGGELTGTVAMLNLCKVVEDGTDLRGKAWPVLQELARGVRLAMIPWLNPDGVERWPFHDTSGLPDDLYARCMMGVAKDGAKYQYPSMKDVFPIPPEKTAFMGAYFNDAGVNLQYDWPSLDRQPETRAWMRYYLDERPDGVLIWHCNAGSMMGSPEAYLPEGFQHEFSRLAGAVQSRLRREGHRVTRMSWAGLVGMGRPYLNQISAVYHVCGAFPIMAELPCGTAHAPFTAEEMLDIGLLTIEETLAYAHQDGLRPYENWEKVKRQRASARKE